MEYPSSSTWGYPHINSTSWTHDLVSVMSGENGVLLHGGEVKKEALDPPPTPMVPQSVLLDYPADSPYSPSTTTIIPKEREYGDDEKSPKCVSDTPMSPNSPDHQYCSSTTFIGDSCYPMLEGNTREDEAPKRLCLVCNDVASGLHYGVASCEACKAFFKRTIQGNIEYTCPASNDCEINKRRRKACQACRFQKCLRMGMLKEGVRLDRVRGGRQKYRRNPEPPYQIQTIPIKKPSLEGNRLLVALIACEQECVMASPQQGLRENEFKTISTLSNLVDKELVNTIGWAKQIPGFAELTLNDQMKLLQSTWAEVLSLSVAFRSVGAGTKVLQYAPDFTVNEKQAKECKAEELFQQTLAIANRLEAAAIAKEEFFLLKAFLMANSDTRVEQPSILRKLRDAILTSLTEASAALRSSNPTYRVYTLLSILPCIRQVDATMRRFWIGVRRAGRINMNKLLVEMLEASVR